MVRFFGVIAFVVMGSRGVPSGFLLFVLPIHFGAFEFIDIVLIVFRDSDRARHQWVEVRSRVELWWREPQDVGEAILRGWTIIRVDDGDIVWKDAHGGAFPREMFVAAAHAARQGNRSEIRVENQLILLEFKLLEVFMEVF